MDTMARLNWLVDVALKNMERPYSLSRAAEYLGVSKSFLYKLTRKSLIIHYKPNGKLIYFNKSDLDKFVYSNKSVNKNRKTAGNDQN